MAGGKKGPNAKAVAANALKSANEEKKKAAAAAQAEAQSAKEWQQGANMRKASREAEAAAKADEAARKRREKAELLAAEEAAMGPGGKAKTGGGAAAKKKNSKKKDDLALLEDALVSAADKKVKKQKALEREKKEKEAAKAPIQPKEEEKLDPLLANTESMMINDELVGRDANKARMQEEGASGIDEALSVLNVGGDGVTLKSAKALYNAFEERMMPAIKEENPGLRMTQYKEKIWQLWKRSPENPANQKGPES